jgi:hypothetical integral membrane protein (TIGR02206 family)
MGSTAATTPTRRGGVGLSLGALPRATRSRPSPTAAPSAEDGSGPTAMLAVISPLPYFTTVGLGALLFAAAIAWSRRDRHAGTAIARGIGVLLLADGAVYLVSELSSGSFSAASSLPLALCNALVLVAALACFTKNQLATELTWFLGLAGSLEGLLTPDLSTPFPHLVFFEYLLAHLAVVATALLLVLGLGRVPRAGAVARVFAITIAYAAVVAVVDWTSNANYLFLRRGPRNWTVLRLLGPWPVYLPVAAALALGLFMLLDAPFRGTRRAAAPGRAPLIIWPAVIALALVVFPLMAVLRRREWRWRLLLVCGKLLGRLAAVRVTVVGAMPTEPVVVCPNHTSFLDGLVVVLARGSAGPLTFLVSQAIGRQLIAGTFLRLIGASFVGATASPRELLAGLAGELGAGRSVVVFPEGSVAAGPLRRFHLGAFALATDAGVPVVPLAISGAATVLPPGAKRPSRGAISVEVGAPVSVVGAGYRVVRALADEVHGALRELLENPSRPAAPAAPPAPDGIARAASRGGAPGAVSSPGSPSSC